MGVSYLVGRAIRVVEDPNRVEVFDVSGKNRSFPVSVFYPIRQDYKVTENANLLSMYRPAIKEALEVFAEEEISEEKLVAYSLPVVDNAIPYFTSLLPVVILSPGFGIDRDLYLETITSLVESGYVVIAVSAPYDSPLTLFPDGRIVLQAENITDEITLDFTTDKKLIRTRMDDIKYLLDDMVKWNEEDDFLGTIFDLSRIGMIGHSLGGATAFNLASEDKRIRCVVLYDASLHLLDEVTIDVPLLNVREEAASFSEYLDELHQQSQGELLSAETDEASKLFAAAFINGQRQLYYSVKSIVSFVKVMGANHMTFSTIGIVRDEVLPSITKGIQEITVAFLREFLSGDQGVYTELINGADRPSNMVNIDYSGLPL